MATLILALLLLERAWKLGAIARFFGRPAPPLPPPAEITIVQPIVSGDANLWSCLQANLSRRWRHRVDFVWVVQEGDEHALQGCRGLQQANVRIVVVPPAPEGVSPKTDKLRAGVEAGVGEVVVCLDDDTVLPEDALDLACAGLAEPGAGLSFGLPHYRSFENLWSGLVATFVNGHSLCTYLPYLELSPPITINGMFYAIRRETLGALGGHAAIERHLCDDFAIARKVRSAGLRLVQTGVLHPIRTRVNGFRDYLKLLKRWFLFPTVSIMKDVPLRELAVFYLVCLAPLGLFPALLLLGGWQFLVGALAMAYGNAVVDRYLGGPTPRQWFLPMLAVQLLLPLHVGWALLSGREIDWRGLRLRVNSDGSFTDARGSRR